MNTCQAMPTHYETPLMGHSEKKIVSLQRLRFSLRA
jgi:hypothetical protein